MALIIGLQTIDDVNIISVDADPSAGLGTASPIGTYATVNSGGGVYFKSSSSDTSWIKLPSVLTYGKVRCVYLVRDTSDASAMGAGVLQNNVYTTAQTAYDGANTLQASLGASSIVVVVVGNVISASVGGITLTSAYNTKVVFVGINRDVSLIGVITASSGTGSGFNVGNSIADTASFINISVGIINTNATGTTGNAGHIHLRLLNSSISTINAEATNASNLTGNSGDVSFGNNVSSNSSTASILNRIRFAGSTGVKGSLQLLSNGTVRTGLINTSGGSFSGSTGGLVNIDGISCTSLDNISADQSVTVKNTIVSGSSNLTSGSTCIIEKCSITSDLSLQSPSTVTVKNCILAYCLIGAVDANIYHCTFIDNGVPSTLLSPLETTDTNLNVYNCTFQEDTGANPCYNISSDSGNTYKFYNSSLIGGSFGIDAISAVTVNVFYTTIEVAVGANVTVV